MAPNGERYPSTKITPDESDLVPVRSIITKKNNPRSVTPDCIGTQFPELTDGTAIGTSFGTSITEAITQQGLSLKHGEALNVFS